MQFLERVARKAKKFSDGTRWRRRGRGARAITLGADAPGPPRDPGIGIPFEGSVPERLFACAEGRPGRLEADLLAVEDRLGGVDREGSARHQGFEERSIAREKVTPKRLRTTTSETSHRAKSGWEEVIFLRRSVPSLCPASGYSVPCTRR